MRYEAIENRIVQVDNTDTFEAAICDVAPEAIKILNEAHFQNSKGHYTSSARLYAKVETLPGFKWVS